MSYTIYIKVNYSFFYHVIYQNCCEEQIECFDWEIMQIYCSDLVEEKADLDQVPFIASEEPN